MTQQFTEKLYTVELSNGARGKSSFAVWQDTEATEWPILWAFDVIGAEQVVKAFRASVSRQARVAANYLIPDFYQTEAYRITKEQLFQRPALHRWFFSPALAASAPVRIIYGFEEDTAGPALQAVLQQTHFPTWPGCGAELLEIGSALGKVQELKHTSNVNFAYAITLFNWLAVYTEGLQTGRLDIRAMQDALCSAAIA